MSFGKRFSFAFSSAQPSTALVPGVFDVAIAGHPFMLDTSLPKGTHQHQSVPYLDKYLTSPVFGSPSSAAEIGEVSLNPDVSWRRSAAAWHHGAGQKHFDLAESDRARFRTSKGIDCWTQGQISLLPDVVKKRTTTNTNLQLVTAGTYLYLADGSALLYTDDLSTWTAVTGVSTAVSSVATDGNTIWVALAAGVYSTTRGSASAASFNGLANVDLLGYANGRLMAAVGAAIYNIVDTTTPTALFTHDNTDWAWVGFCAGDTCIYAAGYSGDYSAIYRIPIKSDGTGLDAPIIAAQLPRGETALGVFNDLGQVFVGTSEGLRMATPTTSGALVLGSVTQVGPVRCATGFGRFVWFGWEDYDSTSTGLGRADLTVINTDAPAYATDLMATAQGQVSSVVTFGGKRAFAVSGVGVYEEDTNLVASGTLDSGLITFDLPDPKVAQAIDVRHTEPLVGSHSVSFSVDEGTFTLLGKHTADTAETPFTCRATKGDVFEIRQTLTRDSDTTTEGPAVTRMTLMAIPAAVSGQQLTVPVLLRSRVQPKIGSPRDGDPGDDLAFLKGLRITKQTFTYQELGHSYKATMQDWQFLPSQPTQDRKAMEGTFIAQMIVQDITT